MMGQIIPGFDTSAASGISRLLSAILRHAGTDSLDPASGVHSCDASCAEAIRRELMSDQAADTPPAPAD